MKRQLTSCFFGLLLSCGLAVPAWAQAHHPKQAGGKVELGSSAAVDKNGVLWVVGKELSSDGVQRNFVTIQSSADLGKSWSPAQRIQQLAEPVSADGENRPKLAFGAHGEIYVAYTKPLAKPYTGDIRFVRTIDGGRTFSAPITVHSNRDNITHRFESMLVDRDGRVFIAWIDKRDAEAARANKTPYRGAGIYYAVSDDNGASFRGDYKLAEHSCECCRIALAPNKSGAPVALWRHVFEPNERDHASSTLGADGKASPLERATFDAWRVDACPHHGPSLAIGADGTRHQTWFNVKGDEGGVYYAATPRGGKMGAPVRLGNDQAEHADVLVKDQLVVLAWKQFDGKATSILGKVSLDGGASWRESALGSTAGSSDQPHLFATPTGIMVLWRTQNEGIRILPTTGKEPQ